jgi:hypothetical protein
MNTSTRRLVYSSIVLAAAVSAYADPIDSISGNESIKPSQAALRTIGSLHLGSDITETSLSAAERLAVRTSFSDASSGPREGFSVFMSASGRPESVEGAADEGAANPARTSTRQTIVADLNTTDAIAAMHSESAANSTSVPTATTNSAEQVVADDSADPDNTPALDTLSVTTTTSSQGASQGFDPQPAQLTPEPASLMTAGSIFLGWGLLSLMRRRRK